MIVSIRSQRGRWVARKIRAELTRRSGPCRPRCRRCAMCSAARAWSVSSRPRRRVLRRFERPVPNDL